MGRPSGHIGSLSDGVLIVQAGGRKGNDFSAMQNMFLHYEILDRAIGRAFSGDKLPK
jgi:hypothetical protein